MIPRGSSSAGVVLCVQSSAAKRALNSTKQRLENFTLGILLEADYTQTTSVKHSLCYVSNRISSASLYSSNTTPNFVALRRTKSHVNIVILERFVLKVQDLAFPPLSE